MPARPHHVTLTRLLAARCMFTVAITAHPWRRAVCVVTGFLEHAESLHEKGLLGEGVNARDALGFVMSHEVSWACRVHRVMSTASSRISASR